MNKILVVLFLIAVAIIIVTGVMRNDRDRLNYKFKQIMGSQTAKIMGSKLKIMGSGLEI